MTLVTFANGHFFVRQELGRDASVLQAHYARNRQPRAPNPLHIHRTPSTSLAQPSQRRKKTTESASRPLSSYPLQWQEVIAYAKQSFRAYVAGKDGFPDALTGVREARECLDDALAVHLEDGGVVEPGQLEVNIRALPNLFLQAITLTKR